MNKDFKSPHRVIFKNTNLKIAPIAKGKQAFSLIEMLMTLLVASLLMAALAPVMTKKVQEKVNVSGLGSIIFNTGKTIYNAPGQYSFVVPDDVYEIKIQAAAGGGGGGGANSTSFTKEWSNTATVAASSSIWPQINQIISIQKGWYAADAVLIGQGGAGGFAYGKYDSAQKCETAKGFRHLPNMADSGRDLCHIPIHLTASNIASDNYWHVIDVQTQDMFHNVCWVGTTCAYGNSNSISNTYDPKTRTICTGGMIRGWYILQAAGYYPEYANKARAITVSEMKRIIEKSDFSSQDKNYLGPKYLDIVCYTCPKNSVFPTVADQRGCQGEGYCNPSIVPLMDGYFQLYFTPNEVKKENISLAHESASNTMTGEPKLVYEVMDWIPYTGGGGSAGKKATGTFKISKDNNNAHFELILLATLEAQKNNENRANYGGGDPRLTYYKNGSTISNLSGLTGTYGENADAGTNAGTKEYAYFNNICYSGTGLLNTTCEQTAEGSNNAITTAGTNTKGGAGRGGAQGGTPMSPKGENGAQYGYGGGGGARAQEVKRNTDGSINIAQTCYPGGHGGANYAKITFKLASAGSGGGAGGAVGLTSDGKAQYLTLKVRPRDVISITVGKGGAGGTIGRGGEDGTDTIIEIKNNKKIVFKGGKGGNTGAFQNITADNLNLTAAQETEGGLGGNYPDFEDFNKTKDGTYKEIIAPVASKLSAKGYTGSADIGGYSGGEGGTTVLGYKGGCGGKQQSTDEKGCKIDDINGTNAPEYSAVSNQNGGAGGGGGGIDPDKAAENKVGLGSGGAGANGFVVIEWLISNE